MERRHHRCPLVAYGASLPAVFAVLLALALLRSIPTLAAGVVGSGTPESCTEAALDAALAGGGLVTFNCGGAAPIIVTSTKTISADTTIDGGGTLTLDGETGTNVLGVDTRAALYLRNLTVRGGPTFVENNGTLAVSNCMLSGNGGYAGGAINNRGTLTITDSTLSGDAAMSGGAVFNVGAMTVTRSTFAGNAAGFANSPHGGAGGDGGAISNCGTLTVIDSTFSGNGGVDGGGIFNAGSLTVINSTFSGNHSEIAYGFTGPVGGSGGAISSSGTLRVTASTFSGNSAAAASGGGGIFFLDYLGNSATVTNTIIAANTGGNCSGALIVDGGHNVQFPGTDCGASIRSADPHLDPAGLKDNGGPTQTIALLPNSPAINAGDADVCATAPVNGVDQRSYMRPGTGYANCSIGAYEYNSPGPPPSCVGDCHGDGGVTVNELITMVNVALGTTPASECLAGDSNHDGAIKVDEIILAVNNALDGCVAVPVSTPTPTATAPVQTPTVTPSCAVTVSGQVYDATAGPAQGIAGAQVFVHLDVPRTFSATADADGRYSLLVPEPYGCRVVSLEASANGFTPTLVPVTPAALLAQPTRNFALTRP